MQDLKYEAPKSSFKRRNGWKKIVAATAAVALSAACSSGNNDNNSELRGVPSATQATPGPANTTPSKASPQDICISRKATNPDYDVARTALLLAHANNFQKATETLGQIKDVAVLDVAEHGVHSAVAARAAWSARQDHDYKVSEELVDTIGNPKIKVAAENAVDLAEAAGAAWSAGQLNYFSGSKVTLKRIEDPKILARAELAVDTAKRENALWQQSPRNTSEWEKTDKASLELWTDLDDDAVLAWIKLDRAFLADTATVVTQASLDCDPGSQQKTNGQRTATTL